MIPWTDAAAKMWEDYCRRTRENLRGSGADADEVVEDLRRHVEEEIRASRLSAVSEEDLRRILARVGEPAAEPALKPEKKGPWQRLFYALLFLFGVVLPAGTLVFELITASSANILFDPLPTWFQVAAVALVPAINLWLGLVIVYGRGRQPRWLGWLSAAAAGVATFYAILYAPFVPISAMAIIFFGIGLVPLAPYFGLLCTLLLRANARHCFRSGEFGHFWPAFGIAFLALTLAQAPKYLTYNGLARADSDNPAVRRSGVDTLRRFGDEELILRSCYRTDIREPWLDVVRWLAGGGSRVSPDQAREIYFRVTGRPFNAVPPPPLMTRAGRWNVMDDEFDFSWDDALGGEAVAGRVKGLSLQSSRLDAVAEPDAAVVYCEWTMEFKNVSPQQREARAQIALPPGGVVSRLTLWINGEEREAAFGGRSQVREAYQKVAVQQRRDPVLVTTCGPDRVLMQCFPVPPDGGTMKVRVGITAPLALESAGRGLFPWPEFLERNFKIAPGFKHAVWLESPLKIAPVNSALGAAADAQKSSLHGDLADGSLGGVLVERPAETSAVWTPALAAGQIIRQRISESAPPAASRIVFVVDGSAGMKPWSDSLAEAIAQIPPGTELALFMADDSALAASRPEAQPAAGIAGRLKRFRYSGGCDNLPALEQAWDLAAAAGSGAVIWIHDAQPVLLSPADSLRQRMERSGKSVPLFDLQLRPGPNRIAEQLDGMRAYQCLPRAGGGPGDALKKQVETLAGKRHPLEVVRDCVTNSTAEGPRVSRHIERLWAKDEASRLAAARRAEAAAKLAASQQLVTPFSGAVVLETRQQYEQNNLTPADAQTVPVIPEPSTWALLITGSMMILWRIKRTRSV